MSDFIKTVLAVVVGIIITSILCMLLTFSFIGALASSTSSDPVLPRSGVLDLNMKRIALGEQSAPSNPADVFASMGSGNKTAPVGILDAVTAINAAAEDPAVEYIYLRTDGMMAELSLVEELRSALEKFRSSGKAVVAYTEAPTTAGYYLSSVADKVYMCSYHGATIMMNGVGSQMIYLKDLLDKLGVNVQLIRHGKYKSAGEMFVRSTPSDENIQQNAEMVQSLWKSLSGKICESRGITPERFDEIFENLEANLPEDFKELGLVDDLMTEPELRAKLTDLSPSSLKKKDLIFIPFTDYVTVKAKPNLKAKEKIAILYAEGDIVDASMPMSTGGVVGDKFAAEVRKVAKDESVKAVVLRVASPGGSVLASEKIKLALDSLGAKKPLIGSYGSYAASGGYWISNNCQKIFTDETTLTGSIGVFSLIPDFSKTLKDVGHVNVVSVGSSSHTDMYDLLRPLSDKEKDAMQKSVEDIYDRFVSNVSSGRDLEADFVDSIGQGRVWTGRDAMGIKLVDEIGGLEDALNYAVIAAGGSDASSYKVVGYPKAPTTAEQIMQMLGGGKESLALAKMSPLEKRMHSLATTFSSFTKEDATPKFYARIPYDIQMKY